MGGTISPSQSCFKTQVNDRHNTWASCPALNGVFFLLQFLNHGWRWVATAISFGAFGLGALLMGALILPIAVVASFTQWGKSTRVQRALRRQVGHLCQLFVWLMRTLGVLDYQISGYEQHDAKGPLLILANHPSLIDVIFLLAMYPESQCVVKRALWVNPFTHLVMRSADYISNADPELLLARCVESLQRGNTLILFPEGTRTGPGDPLDFKAGAATIAVRADCDILPVLIDVSPTTLTKSDPWYSVPSRQVMMRLSVKPTLRMDAELLKDLGPRMASRSFNQRLEAWFGDALMTEYRA